MTAPGGGGALPFPLRHATLADIPVLEQLTTSSVKRLSAGYCTPTEIRSALRYGFGPDSRLIEDRSYYAVEDGARIVGAGGWNQRAALYGGNQLKKEEDPLVRITRPIIEAQHR